jgi:hypothetical protein
MVTIWIFLNQLINKAIENLDLFVTGALRINSVSIQYFAAPFPARKIVRLLVVDRGISCLENKLVPVKRLDKRKSIRVDEK